MLTLFSFDEFQVTGDEQFGEFIAQATAMKAQQRIQNVFVTNRSKLPIFFNEEHQGTLGFVKGKDTDDIIVASSELIYYSPDGEFGVDYVKDVINKKIKQAREFLSVRHWTNIR